MAKAKQTEKEAQNYDQKKTQEYLDEIDEIGRKYGLTLGAKLDFQAGGVFPRLTVLKWPNENAKQPPESN